MLGPIIAAFLLFGSVAMHGGTIWNLLGLTLILVRTYDKPHRPSGRSDCSWPRRPSLRPWRSIFAFLAGGVVLFRNPWIARCDSAAALFKLLLDNYYALPESSIVIVENHIPMIW